MVSCGDESEVLRDGRERVFALVFDVGDEAVATLAAFAEEQKLAPRGSPRSGLSAKP